MSNNSIFRAKSNIFFDQKTKTNSNCNSAYFYAGCQLGRSADKY